MLKYLIGIFLIIYGKNQDLRFQFLWQAYFLDLLVTQLIRMAHQLPFMVNWLNDQLNICKQIYRNILKLLAYLLF